MPAGRAPHEQPHAAGSSGAPSGSSPRRQIGTASRRSRRRSRCSATVVARSRTSAARPRQVQRAHDLVPVLLHHAEAHSPDRLVRRGALGPGDPREPDPEVRLEALDRTRGKRLGRPRPRPRRVVRSARAGRRAARSWPRRNRRRRHRRSTRTHRHGRSGEWRAGRPCTTRPPRSGDRRRAGRPAPRSRSRRPRRARRRGAPRSGPRAPPTPRRSARRSARPPRARRGAGRW